MEAAAAGVEAVDEYPEEPEDEGEGEAVGVGTDRVRPNEDVEEVEEGLRRRFLLAAEPADGAVVEAEAG